MKTKASQIDTPAQWVTLKREYDRNNAIGFGRKSSRQSARWFRLRVILRGRWQSFTVTERAECVSLYGAPINPPGA